MYLSLFWSLPFYKFLYYCLLYFEKFLSLQFIVVFALFIPFWLDGFLLFFLLIFKNANQPCL